MLNLLKLKQEKAEQKAGSSESEGASKTGGKIIPAAQRRVQKGISLLEQDAGEVCCDRAATSDRSQEWHGEEFLVPDGVS
eukprot:730535-Hanusia_phi.AAC.2